MTDLIRTFSALSDETRFAIVERLMREGELPAGRIADQAGMSGAAVSRHLKVLRTAGLISQRIEGTHRLYSIRPEQLQAMDSWINDTRSFWEASLNRLDAFLDLEETEDDDG